MPVTCSGSSLLKQYSFSIFLRIFVTRLMLSTTLGLSLLTTVTFFDCRYYSATMFMVFSTMMISGLNLFWIFSTIFLSIPFYWLTISSNLIDYVCNDDSSTDGVIIITWGQQNLVNICLFATFFSSHVALKGPRYVLLMSKYSLDLHILSNIH